MVPIRFRKVCALTIIKCAKEGALLSNLLHFPVQQGHSFGNDPIEQIIDFHEEIKPVVKVIADHIEATTCLCIYSMGKPERRSFQNPKKEIYGKFLHFNNSWHHSAHWQSLSDDIDNLNMLTVQD